MLKHLATSATLALLGVAAAARPHCLDPSEPEGVTPRQTFHGPAYAPARIPRVRAASETFEPHSEGCAPGSKYRPLLLRAERWGRSTSCSGSLGTGRGDPV